MSEEEYELWFDKDLRRDDFLEAESEDKGMKLIIDIPEQDFHRVCQGYIDYSNTLDGRCLTAISEGVPITDNVTNGDVIKKVFNTTSTQFCELVRMDNIDNGLCCSLDWWNAPYKTESEDKE